MSVPLGNQLSSFGSGLHDKVLMAYLLVRGVGKQTKSHTQPI